LFVLFPLAIVISVLQLTDSDFSYGIFKLFLRYIEVKTQNVEFVFQFPFFLSFRILMKFPSCICQTDLTLLFLFSGVQWIKGKQKGHAMIYKRKRKPKGQSGMDNPHTHATMGTRHRTKTNKTKTQHRKLKR
jgi:hypothetical protein